MVADRHRWVTLFLLTDGASVGAAVRDDEFGRQWGVAVNKCLMQSCSKESVADAQVLVDGVIDVLQLLGDAKVRTRGIVQDYRKRVKKG